MPGLGLQALQEEKLKMLEFNAKQPKEIWSVVAGKEEQERGKQRQRPVKQHHI